MKYFNVKRVHFKLLGPAIATIALMALLSAVPGPPSTTFTRGFMVVTDQATAQAYLGVAGGGASTNPVPNYYVSNFFATNVTVQNSLTVQNLYTVNGSHNLMIVTNAVQMPWTTLTLSGTNVSAVNLAAGSMFKLTLTTNAFFVAPTGLPGTNLSQVIQIHLLEDGTGTWGITMTNGASGNGWLLAGSGASTNQVPTINTNANGVTILTFVTSPFGSTKLYGVPTAYAP